MKRLWEAPAVRFVREMVEIYFEKHVPRASAALVYWLILSLFPLLICVNSFVSSLEVNVASVLEVLEPILPGGLLRVVEDYLQYANVTAGESPAFFAVGAVTTVFFASAAVRSLMDTMAEIYEREGYGPVARFAASLGFSLAFLVAIYLSMVVVLTGSRFFRMLGERPGLEWLSGLWDMPWLKFLLLFGVAFVLVALMYLVVAPPGKPRAPVFLGAFLASAALVAASGIFSVFIGMSSRYSLIYGSLASVIILLLWLYLCGNVLILGNVFNCVRYQRKKEKNISENP